MSNSIQKEIFGIDGLKKTILFAIYAKIDNLVEYCFDHNLVNKITLQETKEAYFRRLSRWDGNREDVIFNFALHDKPYYTNTENDVIRFSQIPTTHCKQLIVYDNFYKEANIKFDIDKLNIKDVNITKIYRKNGLIPIDEIQESIPIYKDILIK